jgi:DNA repair protein RecN (Recombination protein N)
MLRELYVEDFGLIERERLSFGPGLNVLSGETGAGKSLFLEALGAALGGGGGAEMLRAGAQRARVEALFEVPPRLAPGLAVLGLEGEEELVLTREVGREGRSVARLNGRPATASGLRQVAELLVAVHAQHEHQTLFRPERHRQLLDAFAGLEEVREGVAAAFRQGRTLERELAELGRDPAERQRRQELLRHQLAEIDQAQLRPGEEEELREELVRLSNAVRLEQALETAHAALFEGLRGEAAVDLLGRGAAALGEAAAFDRRLEELRAVVEEAAGQVAEAAREISRHRSELRFDPQRIGEIEGRLEDLADLHRKYGRDLDAVRQFRERAAGELAQAEETAQRAAAVQERAQAARGDLDRLAAELSRRRGAAARELADLVAAELGELGMPGTVFQVVLAPREVSEAGGEEVEFLFSANPGEPPRPLARIASGGELSRVMLALRKVLAAADQIPTLVFDEVDAGVGGRAATALAARLAFLGGSHQVVAVTHLAQVAAAADRHICLEKEVQGGRTRTRARELAGEERAAEIARMLDGGKSPLALEHARELMRRGPQAVSAEAQSGRRPFPGTGSP